MTFNLNCYSNQYNLLLLKPHYWQVVVSKSLGVKKNDTIQYNEVSRLNIPTGNTVSAMVLMVYTNDFVTDNNNSEYCWSVKL